MRRFGGKIHWSVVSVVLWAIPSAVVALEATGASSPSSATRVELSAEVARFVAQATSRTETPSPGPADVGELQLSVREAVLLALKNNLDIAIARYSPRITAEDIVIQKAVFDPVFSLTADANRTVTPSSSPGLSAVTSKVSNQDLNASLTQALPIGGSYTLSLTNNRQDTNARFAQPVSGGINPSYETFLTLSVTQDLLKNFGVDVKTAPIKIARNNQAISVTQLRLQANQVVTSVHTAYWNLVFAIENLEVQRRSLRLARDLEELNKARVRAGVAAPVEVTQAEAQAAAQVQNVILAEKAVKDAEDQLKLILNIPDGERIWAKKIIPADRPPFEPAQVETEASIEQALEKRPEYAQAKLNLQNADLNVRVARNQLLPSLQLQGSLGLNGLNGTLGGDYSRLTSGDFTAWSAALVLQYPLGNRAARSAFVQSKLSYDQATTALLNLKRQIISQVREAVRRIEANIALVASTRAARVLAEEQLRVEQKRLEAGVTTTFNVLQFQRDLAAAQAFEVQAVTTYNQNLANLELVKGTVLEKNQLEL
ncbi:MAG: TolC family protein [Candidatus Methylomirabilaceae bacterium]